MSARTMSAVLLAVAVLAGPATAGENLYEKIEKAIEKGVEYLKSCQKDDGSFGSIDSETLYGGGTGPGYPHRAGLTALALYALLKSGVKRDDPVIIRGFAFIDSKDQPVEDPNQRPQDWVKILSSYELSAMILAMEARYNPHKKESIRVTLEKAKALRKRRRLRRPKPVVLPGPDRQRLQDWVRRLIARQSPHGWRYNVGGKKMANEEFLQDMSSTQLAMLALRAASHCHGIKFDRQILFGVIDFCLENQEADGPTYEVPVDPFAEPAQRGTSVQVISGKVRGFCYFKDSPRRHEKAATGSMTTAGVASLLICEELLYPYARYRKRYETQVKQSIRDGMMWIQRHWNIEQNPHSHSYFTYWLSGIERVGDLQGTLVIGKHFWYNEGAEVLVDLQRENGAWQVPDTHFPQDVINTAFALLFLDRATPPVAVTGGH